MLMRRKEYKNHPNVGTVFYSPFFQQRIICTRYKDDETWWFKLEKGGREMKANTRFSYFMERGLGN